MMANKLMKDISGYRKSFAACNTVFDKEISIKIQSKLNSEVNEDSFKDLTPMGCIFNLKSFCMNGRVDINLIISSGILDLRDENVLYAIGIQSKLHLFGHSVLVCIAYIIDIVSVIE